MSWNECRTSHGTRSGPGSPVGGAPSLDNDNSGRLAGSPHPSADPRFLAEVARLVRPVDVLALTAVPTVLASALLLPASVRRGLALSYVEPTLPSAVASHFVHLDVPHLAANLAVYAMVVPVTFLLCALAGRRREFYVAFATFLLGFPVLLSALNVALARPRLGYGFSGVNTAFFGLLPIALCWYAARRLGVGTGPHDAPTLFFACTTLVAVVAVPPSVPSLSIAAVGAVATGVYARESAHRLAAFRRAAPPSLRVRPGYVELGVVGLGAVALFPAIAFPANPADGGQVVNVYAHLLGFALGFIASYVTFALVGVDGSP